jgi:hypothetical protein
VRKSAIRRLTGLLAVACAAGAAAVPASAATTVSVFPPSTDERFGGPGGVRIWDDRGANDIAVGFDPEGGAFVVEDTQAPVRGEDCVRLSNHKVRCHADPSEREVVAFYANGERSVDHRIRIRRSVPSDTEIEGGRGRDVIIGGPRTDFISGLRGNDLLKGRAGNDFIGGSSGHDTERGGPGRDDLGFRDEGADNFFGGGGSDVLATLDGTVDREINCGPGPEDRAQVDPNEQSRAARCEDVQVGSP